MELLVVVVVVTRPPPDTWAVFGRLERGGRLGNVTDRLSDNRQPVNLFEIIVGGGEYFRLKSHGIYAYNSNLPVICH